MKRGNLHALILCVIGFFIVPSFSLAGQKVIRLAHPDPIEDATHVGFVKFKDHVERESNGGIAVDIFPNGELGNDTTTSPAVQMGELTMALASAPHLASLVSDLYVLDMPFAWNDDDHLWTALNGELGRKLAASMIKAGIKPIIYYNSGFRQLANTRRAIKEADDIKGLKIRVLENAVHVAFWKALGANPTPMATGEVFTALQQRIVDGSENSYVRLYKEKLFEAMTHISNSKHILSPYIAFMNLAFYNSLTPDEQKIVGSAAKVASDYHMAESARIDRECFEAIVKNGVAFTPISDPERQKIRSIAQPAALEIIKQRVSPEVLEAFRAVSASAK
ncbi:MAG: TRAP transporter substrate-binding protein [Planctomycetota bacterium]|jgi:tripartite ATP-independent transporter DctP family solute receptor|nr:TRAP transporter substrate-binding protein [Planctomycetota bacterium]